MEAGYADYGDLLVTEDIDSSAELKTMRSPLRSPSPDTGKVELHPVLRSSLKSGAEDLLLQSIPRSKSVADDRHDAAIDSFKGLIKEKLDGAQKDLADKLQDVLKLLYQRLEVTHRLETENKALKSRLDLDSSDGFDTPDETAYHSTGSTAAGVAPRRNSKSFLGEMVSKGRRNSKGLIEDLFGTPKNANSSVEESLVDKAHHKASSKTRKGGRTAFNISSGTEKKSAAEKKDPEKCGSKAVCKPKGHSKKATGASALKPMRPSNEPVPKPVSPVPILRTDGDADSDLSPASSSFSGMADEQASDIDDGDLSRDKFGDSQMRRLASHSGTANRLSQADFFEVLPVWRYDHKPLAAKLARIYSKVNKVENRVSNIMTGPMGSQIMVLKSWRLWIVHPNSFRRASWDFLSLFLVLYDMVVIPLQLFDPPEIVFFTSMTWTTRVFWTLDIPASFVTGYMNPDGTIEARPKKIARKYVSSWFLLDLPIVFIDWLELLWQHGSVMGYARMGKASRTIRLIRMVRLLRLIRMRQVFRLLAERIQSERLIIVADIVKIMMIIVGLGHVIACIWYGIGAREDEQNTWLEVHKFDKTPLTFRYTTSLHWSLLLFSGGTDEIVPQNTGERVYAIFVFLLAFVMAAVFVSSLTSSMTQLHMLASQQQQKLSVLRRYLHQNGVSNGLALRVMRSAQHAVWEQKRLMPESSVELLLVVSEPLRVELHFELYAPVLAVHPFFAHYMEECPQVMRKVCHHCVGLLLISRGDIIFNAGEIPAHPKMYIICSGRMVYREITGKERTLGIGEWISEACLWCPWMHRGLFMGATECRLCLLDARKFQDIVGEFDHTDFDFDPKKYATEFVASLNHSHIDVSDMPLSPDSQVMNDVKTAHQESRVKRALSPPTYGTGIEPETSPARRMSVLMPVRRFSEADKPKEEITTTVAEIVASNRAMSPAGGASETTGRFQRVPKRQPSLLFTTPLPGLVREGDG